MWEQEKLDGRKMLENRADFHPSGARCDGRIHDSLLLVVLHR